MSHAATDFISATCRPSALALAPCWAGTPDREGVWEWRYGEELREIDVYESPHGWLAVWCDDFGLSNYEPQTTEEPGHVPVAFAALAWTGRWRSF